MAFNKKILHFFFPSFTPKYLIRVSLVALFAYLIFGYLLVPFTVQGISMEPTYPHGGFNFCWRGRYLFSEPKRFDVVMVRFAGRKVMLLKRVVAQENENIEFRDGKLFINGKEIGEPHVRYPCHWNLSPRRVEKDSVYVVGDNRNMPIENHIFGQTLKNRIIGGPLW